MIDLIKIERKEIGATMVEYAVGLAILLAIFVVVGQSLQEAGEIRRDKAMEGANMTVPCAPGSALAGLGEDACK